MADPSPSNTAMHPLRILYKLSKNSWRFTQDDMFTFVLPNVMFGTCVACAGPPFVSESAAQFTLATLMTRIPMVWLFNWINTLVFDISNQRLSESVVEDKLNKPWRPIASGHMTCTEARQALLLSIPLALAISHYLLGVGSETACIIIGCWVYNDLKAGDDSWILRNGVLALFIGVFNWGSLKVAIGGGQPGPAAFAWVCLFSLVIFTTMHIQDLKDQEGDKAKGGRWTAPLVLGDRVARWSLAVPIAVWGPICAWYCRANVFAAAAEILFGVYVAWRCLSYGGKLEDRWTWQLWSAWLGMLSFLLLRW